MIRKILFCCFVFGVVVSVKAQLSDLHYLPPLKQGINNAGISEQAVYLSTPEPTLFEVNVYRGTSNTPVATFNISNTAPGVYNMSNGDNNIILVNNSNTGKVLKNSGLRFESPSGNKFYVNYRGSSASQSASLTSKGRQAFGKKFKWGGVPNLGSHVSKSNTLGIMATEDNTTINLFGYDPDCQFRVGNNIAGITANIHQITLNANESFVYETYIGNNPTKAHEDGWIGASIVADKNIVISNGSINFGRQAGSGNRDAGIDQPVPENKLGKEYVFVRGNGHANGWTEFPLIIAITDNTQIFVNGSTTPIATLNNGEYFEVPSSFYSSNTAGANMLVQTSKDAYAYQCVGGSHLAYTQGLNFVAPLNCLLPDVMDNIPDISNMAGTQVSGGLTIIAAKNTADANIHVTDGNGSVTLPASNPVAGSTDWKTYFIPNLNGNVSIQSTGPMAIGFFGYNGARGVAGYFSGFDTVPEVTLEIRGASGCFVGSEIFEATSNFDAYQWFEDGVAIPGANSPSYAPQGAGEFFVRGTKGPCTYDSNAIQALYCDPDVIVNKTIDKAEILEGETATFTIRVRNLGVGPVTHLQITDNIPTGLSLVSAFTVSGSWSGNTWNIGTLDGGDTAILKLKVKADEIDTLPLLSLTNTAYNTQDQTDSNTTPDHPSAHIVVHNDYDNDGVNDTTDLDDDNDGVYDLQECPNLAFNLSKGDTYVTNLNGVKKYLIFDIFTIDNSFNFKINGNDIAGEIQFHNDSEGNLARFLDGFSYGENSIPQVWKITGSPGSPVIRVVVDETGKFQLFGAQSSNGPLEPMVLTTPANTFSWNLSGNNTVSIQQKVAGPTHMRGISYTTNCDTDLDGIPDHLDLDSDGDGCSDANEFYKDETADGGDGGEYGTGVPVVESSNGKVNSASYVRVVAPEILLGNTSEDLGGNNINGQALSLGQTFEYVLRFQNTGDDRATNYTIRDILPKNISLDKVDITNAPGTTHTYDINTNTISFSIPNNLVEVGDPKYSIRIRVTLASNCSDFVDACSSQLVNKAYSTYKGVTNTNTFTDEMGSNSITGCPRTPETADNSIRNDLSSCNEAKKVQLCGENVILSAGKGFTSYKWVLDTNGNKQIDAGDTVINDGDPDSNPRTLLVTTPGIYIVEKKSEGSCPKLIEIMNVQRFGTTQTNPIIDYFNKVNSDLNSENDLKGEIATCSVDGDALQKIFLCGANDEATIQLGISDAQSIEWQKLEEGSCSAASADCANKNATCNWSNIATSANYTISDEGDYRIVINYQNGCFNRFYFKVFKNNLDIAHTSKDILCATPGNIRITNVKGGYGFQLINAVDNSIIVPFSASNGPNFDISSSGTYKVQITALNPSNNAPIEGSCIFETEDIGIKEINFSTTLTMTPADCNTLGKISISALNALPNYSYELRLDDGSNGGLGTLVSNELAIKDNTFTFLNVNPEDYIVIIRTQDGCVDSKKITVTQIPELTLSATTSENISCYPGIVNLTPAGGLPSPNYEMAIWSKDGTQLYSNENSVPDDKFQTNASFLFGNDGNPNREGDYQFILRDGNGCFAISNEVRVEDLGILAISATDSGINCADASTATMTITVTGGTAPYQYSLDGGATYQNTKTFANLSAGFYTITVKDASGINGIGCVESFDYEISQPYRLTASAAIIEDASCNSSGALVKILNGSGGQAPYEYSFDGGTTFSSNASQNLLAGTYQLSIKDNLGCTFDMEFTVPNSPIDPSFTSNVIYDCDGLGTITIQPSNTTDFIYEYALNANDNTPASKNVFDAVSNGTHTVSVSFASAVAPNQSTLFLETFGAGPTTMIAEIGPDYCFEPQDGSTVACNRGPSGILVNGEYTVTKFVTNPISVLTSPKDHTGLVDGRFLAIDISTFSDTGVERLNTVLWKKQNVQVLPNREILINFWAYNLMNVTGSGNNPEVLVEIYDNSGSLIFSKETSEIPKNTTDTDWHQRMITFNPGANTNIDIVFKSNVNSNDGNDLILDDIQASQIPDICEKTQDITVVVEDNQEFVADELGKNNPNCNGASDGSIRFEVSNFDTATGFEYSIDGGANWNTSLVSPVTTAATLADGTYTVQIRRLNDTSCTTSFTSTLTQPSKIVPLLAQTGEYTCFNTGATLKASASGGSPGYEYQLENTSNTVIATYQTDATFTNIPEGDYVVRVKDKKGCEIVSTNSITVDAPEKIDFNLSATACYDGQNNASVTVDVTKGNGNYKFKINDNTWQTPIPSTATTYTFSGLSNGSYNIQVTDDFGCVSALKTISIKPTLTAEIDVVDVSSCANGSITINASGGDGNYSYAFLTSGTTVQDSDFKAANVFAITSLTVGDYDVYARDHNGTKPFCQFMQKVTLKNIPPLAFTAEATNPTCFGEKGSIKVLITEGSAPYTYKLVDVDHAMANQTQSSVVNTTKTYFNLIPGNYSVTITDATGCSKTVSNVVVTQPDELTTDITGITPASCTGDVNDFGFAFNNYPTTLGTIEFSDDGGATWIKDNTNPGVSDRLTGYVSGSTVYPSMRTIDTSGNTVCQVDLDPFIIPYPLDDLDISISAVVVECNELQVTVQGGEGVAPYSYAYSDDPGNFNPLTASWQAGGSQDNLGNTVPAGAGMYVWENLIPGKTYVFYVKDFNNCTRQSTVNVNDITTNPMEITASYEPSCNGASDGEINYTIVDSDGITEPMMNWTLYDINDNIIKSSPGNIPYSNTISITNLAEGEYYIVVQQVDSSGLSKCISGSENLIIEELDLITATLKVVQDISCEAPGIISIENIQGGGGVFTYNISGPPSFTTITGITDNPVEIAANSPAGSYMVSIADQFGCSALLGSVNLKLAPNPKITNLNVDNCGSSATVTIQATSASPAKILFSIDAGSTYFDNDGIFKNIPVGSYTALIKDGNGCTAAKNFKVHSSLQASVNLDKALGCGVDSEAKIKIEVAAGSGNYEYDIVNTSGTFVARQTLASNPLTALVSTADTYTVNIYDTKNSPECKRTFTVNIPTAIVPDFTAESKAISCFGANDGAIVLTQINNGNNPLVYSLVPNNGTFNAAKATYENLPPGNYKVTAKGPNGCTTVKSNILVNEPNAITFDAPTVTPFKCTSENTPNNARIAINTSSISGGSNTFVRYEFVDNASGNTLQNGTESDYIFTDFAGGDISVIVYDSNGCSGQNSITIPAFDALGTATISVDNAISCSTFVEDISISISSSITNNGSNPTNYKFRQLPSGVSQDSNQFTNLSPGNYTFAIRNVSTGCEVTIDHTVANPNTFNVSVEKLADVVCFGDNGSVKLLMSDTTYTGGFNWNVYNTNGTLDDRSDDGAAVISGMLPDFGPTLPISLPAGNYLVEVTQDAFPNCSQVRSFSITSPSAAIGLDPVEISDVGCSNNQGTALISPSGGEAPYNIVLTNTTTGTATNVTQVNKNLFQNLGAGQYSVSVTDALSCTNNFTNVFELVVPDAISGTISATTLTCDGDADAIITFSINPRNVTTNYRYVLNTFNDLTGSTLLRSTAPQTSSNFINQGAGFYSISVVDDMGCSFESNRIEIVNPTETHGMLVTLASLSCKSNAELQLTATGGEAPYMWSADGITFDVMNGINGPNTHVFQNITAGTYQFYIRDSFNCISTFSNEIKISALKPLTLDVDTTAAIINCNGESTAIIEANADGAKGNYQYGLFSDAALTNVIRPYQNSGTFVDLSSQNYYVSVTSEDCELTSDEVVITEPDLLVVNTTITEVSCNGGSDGAIVIEATGGSGDYQYAISPNLNQFDNKNTFEDLSIGDYTVIVQDGKGCFELVEFSINEPEALEITLNATHEICSGDSAGTIMVNITGGTAPYSTRLSTETSFVQDRVLFTNLQAGAYIIFVRDANGCDANSAISVEVGANLNATAEVTYECSGTTPNNRLSLVFEDDSIASDLLYALDSTNSSDLVLEPNFENLSPGNHYITIVHAYGCMNTIDFEVEDYEPLVLTLEQLGLNEITANAEGGREGYTYYFNDKDNGEDNTFYIKRTGTYTVRVVDENGCESIETIDMEFIDIEIPNYFTPNGDGNNDKWMPKNIEQFPNIFISIFDRYGRKVYQIIDNEDGWNGLYEDADLPTGDYWYKIKLNGEDDKREFIGHFTLYR